MPLLVNARTQDKTLPLGTLSSIRSDAFTSTKGRVFLEIDMPTGHYPRKPLVERFWEKVRKTDGCWLWTGSVVPKGYGQISLNNIPIPAHRLSYRIHFGEIPAGLCVCHRCDNPPCVNPAHLWLGTRIENNLDCERKGRRRFAVGEACPQCKLKERHVREIRKKFSEGASKNELASQYGVVSMTIHAIIKGDIWRHVK